MIDLPRKSDDGTPRISYSQINSWNSVQAFNQVQGEDGKLKNISGKAGYILDYFLDYQFPDSPMNIYAPWGQRVEAAICEKDYTGFDPEEIEHLKSVQPIGCFQQKVEINFGEFVLEGFIDDCNSDRTHIRDYKSCSKNTVEQYKKDDYHQLDVYALQYFRETGLIPHTLEVVPIMRTGSHFKLPLKCGGIFPYIQRKTSADRLYYIENKIISTVQEISDAYKVFKQINSIV